MSGALKILALPKRGEHLLRRYVPKSCHVSKKMKSSGQKEITGDVEEVEAGNDCSELKVRFDSWLHTIMSHVFSWHMFPTDSHQVSNAKLIMKAGGALESLG